jgi:glutaminase
VLFTRIQSGTFIAATLFTATITLPQLSAQQRSPVAPKEEQLKAAVNDAYKMFKNDASGKNADYIPYLAHVDSKLFGIAVVTTDNRSYTLGDLDYSFSIQSISKVLRSPWRWKNKESTKCSRRLATNRLDGHSTLYRR